MSSAAERVEKLTADSKKYEKEKNKLEQYYLQNYLCSRSDEILKKASEVIDLNEWEKWKSAILLESDSTIFDMEEDIWEKEIREEIQQDFFYLNLSASQSILLFYDTKCDYRLVAKRLYTKLKLNHQAHLYLSISKIFEGYKDLPDIMSQLERQMEERFYRPEGHIFFNEEDVLKTTGSEAQDSQLVQRISEDIVRRDLVQLWKHFYRLTEKYSANTQFSALYVKFVFSSVIQELYQEEIFARENHLENEVKELYSCTNIKQILKIAEENLKKYEKYVCDSLDDHAGLTELVKKYIEENYNEELKIELLAKKFGVYPGYLCCLFKRKAGMNLKRFIWIYRMKKAKELLVEEKDSVASISKKVGFKSPAYFQRSFCAYYGYIPEECRANGVG